MSNDATQLIVELRLDFAWRMLATLGAPASAPHFNSAPVDPECTILLGAISAQDDPRVGEATRWLLQTTHRSLSVNRMKTLAAQLGDVATDGTGYIAATATGAPSLRQWARAFNPAPRAPHDTGAAPDDRLVHRVGAHDVSKETLLQPGAYRLRMRMAFGVGARTEALTALLVRRHGTSGPERAWMTVPELEQATGFGKRHLLDQLPDMSRAGLLEHTRDGRTHRFRARPQILTALAPIPTNWVDWPAHIATLLELEAAMRALEMNPTIAGAMDATRLVTNRPDVLSPHFAPHGDPNTLPERLRDWLLASTRLVTNVNARSGNEPRGSITS